MISKRNQWMLSVALSLLMACGNGQGDADKASVKVKVKTEQVGQAVTPGCEWHYVGQIESGLSTSVSFTGMDTLANASAVSVEGRRAVS